MLVMVIHTVRSHSLVDMKKSAKSANKFGIMKVFEVLQFAIVPAVMLIAGKLTFFKETVITFGVWHFAVCAVVIVLYLALSMLMPLMIIGSNEPKEVLKEE